MYRTTEKKHTMRGVVELMSRLVEEWKDVQTHKTDRTDGIFEWVDESTDYSKAKETRYIGVSTHS